MPPLSVRYRAVQLLVPICGTKQSKTKPNGKLRVRFRLLVLVLLPISGPVTVTVPVPVPPSHALVGCVRSSQVEFANEMAKLAAVRSTSFSRLKCQRCRLCSIPHSAPLREKKNFTGLKSFSSFYVHFVILLLFFFLLLLLFFSSSAATLVQLELCLSLSALNQFRRRIWTHMSRELARQGEDEEAPGLGFAT